MYTTRINAAKALLETIKLRIEVRNLIYLARLVYDRRACTGITRVTRARSRSLSGAHWG